MIFIAMVSKNEYMQHYMVIQTYGGNLIQSNQHYWCRQILPIISGRINIISGDWYDLRKLMISKLQNEKFLYYFVVLCESCSWITSGKTKLTYLKPYTKYAIFWFGLKRCNQKRKVSGSYPTRCSTRLRDLI